MKKNLLTVMAAVTLIVTGCKKEQTDIDTTPPRRLTKIEHNNNTVKHSTLLKYDSYGYMTELQSIFARNGMYEPIITGAIYARDANHRITTETYDNNNIDLKGYYIYNNSGQVDRVEYHSGATLSYTVRFSYRNDQVVKIEYINPQGEIYQSENYTYTDGNITKVTSISGGSLYTTITDIVYDDKINPLSTITGMPITISLNGNTFERFSANNPLSYKRTMQGYTSLEELKLEYNTVNYVEKEYRVGQYASKTYTYEVY